VFDGAINGEAFLAFVEQALVPTPKPDEVVILDNLGSHKLAAVRAAYVHFLRNALDYVPRKEDDDRLMELRWFCDRRELAEAPDLQNLTHTTVSDNRKLAST
jgi:Transposase, Mutator family